MNLLAGLDLNQEESFALGANLGVELYLPINRFIIINTAFFSIAGQLIGCRMITSFYMA